MFLYAWKLARQIPINTTRNDCNSISCSVATRNHFIADATKARTQHVVTVAPLVALVLSQTQQKDAFIALGLAYIPPDHMSHRCVLSQDTAVLQGAVSHWAHHFTNASWLLCLRLGTSTGMQTYTAGMEKKYTGSQFKEGERKGKKWKKSSVKINVFCQRNYYLWQWNLKL